MLTDLPGQAFVGESLEREVCNRLQTHKRFLRVSVRGLPVVRVGLCFAERGYRPSAFFAFPSVAFQ